MTTTALVMDCCRLVVADLGLVNGGRILGGEVSMKGKSELVKDT